MVNRLAAYTGAGIAYRGPVAGRDDDDVGLGVAGAHNSEHYRRAERGAGRATRRSEIAVELTYRAALTASLALQVDVQYVAGPNTDPTLGNALVFGMRLQYGF